MEQNSHQIVVRTTPLLLVPVRFLIVVVLSFLASTTTTTTHAFAPSSRWTTTPSSRRSIIVVEGSSSSSPPETMHPPLSREEIVEWLRYVPVYAITDQLGNPIVNNEKKASEKTIFNFYVSYEMAESTHEQLKFQDASFYDSSGIAGFSLGKIWFDLLMAEAKDEDKEYILVPSENDVVEANMLRRKSLEKREQELMKTSSTSIDRKRIRDQIEEEYRIIEKNAFNDIPIFMIDQLAMQTDRDQQNKGKKAMIPVYFYKKDLMTTFEEFIKAAPKKHKKKRPQAKIQLFELFKLVELMEKPSAFDFRSLMIMQPIPEDEPPT